MGRAAHARSLAWLLAASAGAGCVDLLHSTDFETLCDHSPEAAPCRDPDAAWTEGADASAEAAPVEVCSPTHEGAVRDARKACALVGACAGPLGASSMSACLPAALAAFDCVANPALRVRGEARAYWACVRAAKTCDDVLRCVFPGGVQECTGARGGGYLACGADENASTRVRCEGDAKAPPSAVESCVALGRRCAQASSVAPRCAAASSACSAVGCAGSAARICAPDGDRGVDCALYGAGRCVEPQGDTAEPRCAPDDRAPECDASAVTPCTSPGVAGACIAGRSAAFDCGAVGGRCDPDAGASEISSVLPWSRCVFGDAPCERERCIGEALGACVAGFEIAVSCRAAGLGPCALRTVDGETRAACAPL